MADRLFLVTVETAERSDLFRIPSLSEAGRYRCQGTCAANRGEVYVLAQNLSCAVSMLGSAALSAVEVPLHTSSTGPVEHFPKPTDWEPS